MLRSLLAAFNPRHWALFVQHIRRAPDYTPAMLPIAIFGTLGYGSGLSSNIPYARTALIALLLPLLVVALVGAALAMCDSLAAVLRSGFRGFFGPDIWFEIARATLIAGILLSVTSVVLLFFGVSALEIAGIPIVISFVSFFVGSLIGYVLSAKCKHKSSGSAFECADFFLPQFLAFVVIVGPVILLGQYFDPMWIIASAVVCALTLAAVLKTIEWRRASQRDA